jgi:hypothetical protein
VEEWRRRPAIEFRNPYDPKPSDSRGSWSELKHVRIGSGEKKSLHEKSGKLAAFKTTTVTKPMPNGMCMKLLIPDISC